MKRWLVRLTPGDRGEVLVAERYRIEGGGVLVLLNGSIFEPVLVRAYGGGQWHAINPVTQQEAA